MKWKASVVKSAEDHNISSFHVLLWVEIWRNINEFQVVLLSSVWEKDIKPVKNAVVRWMWESWEGQPVGVSIISSRTQNEVDIKKKIVRWFWEGKRIFLSNPILKKIQVWGFFFPSEMSKWRPKESYYTLIKSFS